MLKKFANMMSTGVRQLPKSSFYRLGKKKLFSSWSFEFLQIQSYGKSLARAKALSQHEVPLVKYSNIYSTLELYSIHTHHRGYNSTRTTAALPMCNL